MERGDYNVVPRPIYRVAAKGIWGADETRTRENNARSNIQCEILNKICFLCKEHAQNGIGGGFQTPRYIYKP